MSALCQSHGATRRFGATVALHDADYAVAAPGLHAIVGPSGSGKTTLLNLLAGLDTPTGGAITLCGHELHRLSAAQRGRHRAEHVGFVFQRFNLVTTLTAGENITLLADTRNIRLDRDWIEQLAGQAGVGALLDRYPLELSGGQQQRVALVRALAHRPSLLFADEPTGNLDTDTSRDIHGLLAHVARDHGVAVVMVTHDRGAAAACDTLTTVRDGEVSAPGYPSSSETVTGGTSSSNARTDSPSEYVTTSS